MSTESEDLGAGVNAAGVVEHPIRWLIGALLGDRPMSARELAEVMEIRPSTVRRHLRTMREAEVIEVVEVRNRRNTAEQVYRAAADFIFTRDERGGQSVEERRRFDAYTLKVGMGEAVRSLASAQATRTQPSGDECVVRIGMLVDARGWTELARAHEEFFLRVRELRDQAAGRLRDEGSEPIRATSLILFFEASPPP